MNYKGYCSSKCGSNTLIIHGDDLKCYVCGHIIKDYKILKYGMGEELFNKFYDGLKKESE